MSQPVSSVRAPRLMPLRRNLRRSTSTRGFGRSMAGLPGGRIIVVFFSFTGMGLRLLEMDRMRSAAEHHGDEGFRDDDNKGDVNDHEQAYRGHKKEMQNACGRVASEQCRQPAQLHRLPYREAGQ